MRYFTFVQPINDTGDSEYVTMSEQEIWKEYYPDWYEQMCDKYEQAYVDENYSFEDCIEDWMIIHQAWESK